MITKKDIDKNIYVLLTGAVLAAAVLSFFSYKTVKSIGTPKLNFYLPVLIFTGLIILAIISFFYWALKK